MQSAEMCDTSDPHCSHREATYQCVIRCSPLIPFPEILLLHSIQILNVLLRSVCLLDSLLAQLRHICVPLRHFCNSSWPVPCTVATRRSKRLLNYTRLRVSSVVLTIFTFAI